MWLIVMFDLPTETALDRKRAARFRKDLLDDGFSMIQFSVYARPCPSEENAQKHMKRVEKTVPPSGQVRVAKFTDKQWGATKVYFGQNPAFAEKPPDQLSFF